MIIVVVLILLVIATNYEDDEDINNDTRQSSNVLHFCRLIDLMFANVKSVSESSESVLTLFWATVPFYLP